jgi:hypothetical protein
MKSGLSYVTFVGVMISILMTTNTYPNKLVIFHIDLNSVSLREDYLRKWINQVSDMGFNAILWEIKDEILWETCPECVSPDVAPAEKSDPTVAERHSSQTGS